jgi:hypothetical protein
VSLARLPNVRFEQTMTAYLASPLGKARSRISEIERLSRKLNAQAHDVGIALTRGTGALEFAEITAETVRDLRIAAADLETYCRLIEESNR